MLSFKRWYRWYRSYLPSYGTCVGLPWKNRFKLSVWQFWSNFFVLVKLRMDQKLELNPLKGGFSAKPDTPPSLSWKVPHEFSLKGFGFWQAKPPAHPEKKGPFESRWQGPMLDSRFSWKRWVRYHFHAIFSEMMILWFSGFLAMLRWPWEHSLNLAFWTIIIRHAWYGNQSEISLSAEVNFSNLPLTSGMPSIGFCIYGVR